MKDDQFNELHGFYFDDLEVGMEAKVSKMITQTDVAMFANLSGDLNPLHMDDGFAERTRTKGRIVHGMLIASLISTIVGTKLPGPGGLWMGQTLRFLRPVRIGDTVQAAALVIELTAHKQRARMRTTCTVEDDTVIEGEALVWVPTKYGRDRQAQLN